MRIAEILRYHILIFMKNSNYLAGMISLIPLIILLKDKIIEDVIVFVLLGAIPLLFSNSFDPKKIGAILKYRPDADPIVLFVSIVISLPFILCCSYLYPGFLLSNIIAFTTLSILPLSISSKIRCITTILGLLAISGRKMTLIGYIILVIAYLVASVLKDKLIRVYLVRNIYISTLSFEIRGIAIILSVIFTLIAQYLRMQGVKFGCGVGAFKALYPLSIVSDEQKFDITWRIGSTLVTMCIIAPMIWPLFLVGDSYVDSYIAYLHYLKPESYLRRLIKEILLFLISLIVPLTFYSLAILEREYLGTLYILFFMLAIGRIVLSITLPSFERNSFLFLYLIILGAPFIIRKIIPMWIIPLLILISPLAYFVRIKLERVIRNV
ncbi:hypothetical protein PNA2_1663 [Pyrococcus sp. NA2]|nr:hypothetical protein PNA2_1663 [Pyrococcus sp. NA2]